MLVVFTDDVKTKELLDGFLSRFVQKFKVPRNMSVRDELWPGWTVLEIIFKLLQIAVWCLWPVVLCAWYFYAMQKWEDNVCFVTPLIIIKIFATLQLWLLLIKFGTVYYTWNTSTTQAVKLAYIRVFYFMMAVKLLLCSELLSVPL